MLVANSYRQIEPNQRDMDNRFVFAGDAVNFSRQFNFALLDTRDLYQAVVDVIEGRITEKEKLLRELRQTIGVYSYNTGK